MNPVASTLSKTKENINLSTHEATPYASAVANYAGKSPLSLMVPGHGKYATGASLALQEFFGERAVQLDIPLMIEGVDLGPDSPLVEARRLAADAWGARETWFMTNGASQANRTAAIAIRGLGKGVLMQRSSHSSFSDGVLAAGMKPLFLLPSIDHTNGVAHGVSPEMLERAFQTAEEAVTSVYVVSPSYFGATADIAGLADVAHRHGAALIVDNAWGAHFGFHDDLPESPVRLGADIVVSSTHKLAGSLGQSAMLHLGDGPFADELKPLIDRAYTMTASTSQSSLLLASLDIARKAMVHGFDEIGESIVRANELRERARADERFSVLSDGFDQYEDIAAIDPLRVVLDISRLGVTGHWFAGECEKHGLYFEMATATTVVAVFGASAAPDVNQVWASVCAAADTADSLREAGKHVAEEGAEFPQLPAAGALVMLPSDAYFEHIEEVSWEDAVGRISADSLAAYPPGVPNVIPGEVITQETVDFLRAVAASPTGYVRGAVDSLVTRFRVVGE